MFFMKNMRKLVSILLCIALLGGVLAGCGAGKKSELSVVAMTGPTGIGMVKLMADSEAESTEVDYTFELVGAADEITGKIVNGDVDIAAVPCNLASVLYNKTEGDISVLAVNTKGVLYILEAGGESIQSVADLAGKTIVSTGKGTTPEYTLNYLLTSNGLNPETDVTIEYKSEATEVVAALKQGLCDVAMLPQPMVTAAMAQVSDLRVALDVTKEWANIQGEGGTDLITGCVIVRNEVLENNKKAVDTFLKEYKASINYVNENVADAAQLVADYGIIANAAIAEKAIPACNIVFMGGEEMKANMEGYLGVLAAANPKAVGGALPDAAFYYIP
jgi:NitT/TauT family transport system substrate-binding protein